MPGLTATAALYGDDLPRRPQPLPRFITEFVMAQLESPTNLARLPDATTRALVVVLLETGLRANDACALPFNPVIDDSAGWPCLRYYNAKMAAEQLVPLSAAGAAAIRAQQAHLRQTWPDFQTTPEFLDIHRRQRDDTRTLIATAEADGRFRLAANHRQVHDNLDHVITALEALG